MQVNQSNHQIFQIFYDDKTRESIDPGFLPLNNLNNERPDWSEYWPIRNYLLNQTLDDNTYYGFLSPKFNSKTGLTAIDVHAFLDKTNADVVSFSPYFDQMTFPFNPFEQASIWHEGSYPTVVDAFSFLKPGYSVDRQVMTSANTIYSNFFAAKKSFWICWLDHGERLFDLAEKNASELAVRLNALTNHYSTHPLKVFIMERIASFILLHRKDFEVKLLNPINSLFAAPIFPQFKSELIQMDALKRAYVDTGFIEYLEGYCALRNEIVKKTQK